MLTVFRLICVCHKSGFATDAQDLLHNQWLLNDPGLPSVKGKRPGIFISARIIQRCAEISDIQQWQPDIPLSKKQALFATNIPVFVPCKSCTLNL